jgi:hypothetical protein
MKILNHLDLSKTELRNAAVQVLANAPSDPVVGQLYFDSINGRALLWDGSAWTHRAMDSGLLNGNNAAYYLDRINHTGTQTASTISDLASVVQAYRLDQFAAPITSLNLNGQRITGLAAPTDGTDAANRQFVVDQVQSAATGISVKDPVRVVSETNVALTGLQTIDGVALVGGDRVLLVGQTNKTQNGVYVAAAGAWSRAIAEDETNELKGAFWLVNEGTQGQKTQWIVNNSTAPEIGTDEITIVKFGAITIYTASTGVQLVGSDFRAQVVAGGGVTASGSGLAVDTAIVARKFSQNIGDGVSVSITVTHNLGTEDITVSLKDSVTKQSALTSWVIASANAVTLTFATAPTANAYRVTITG